MAFERWGYQFEGAWATPHNLESKSGVYVIWCKIRDDWFVLDVGESSDVKSRVLIHDRKNEWKSNCRGVIQYSVTYTPNLQQAGRMEIERRIRSMSKPRCGER